MKKSLESIVKNTRRILATSLIGLTTYLPAQETFQIKTTDGNWNEKAPATLYFESTLGNIGTDPKKDPSKQFKTQVYFSGRRKSENNLEFFYTTTDIENPSLDAPTLDNTQTKVIYFSYDDTTAEINYQKAIMMDNKGKIRFEETVPKEKASSILMKFGINLTDKADQSIRDYILLKTAGLLDVSIKESLTKYCENQANEIRDNAKNETGYELAINNIPLWTRDRNFAIRDKQIGWMIGISASSKNKKEVPFALYCHLALKRETEREKGTLNAYTETFTIPAEIQKEQTCITKNSNPLEGMWLNKSNKKIVYIGKDGKLIYLPQDYTFTTPFVCMQLVDFNSSKARVKGYHLDNDWNSKGIPDLKGTATMPNNDLIEIEAYRDLGKVNPLKMEKIELERIKEWEKESKENIPDISKISTSKVTNPPTKKEQSPTSSGPWGDIPNGNKKVLQALFGKR